VKGLWPEPGVALDCHSKDAIDAAIDELGRFAISTAAEHME
jgi:hypothetical protein